MKGRRCWQYVPRMTAPMKRLMVTLANVVNLCVDEQKNKENSKIKKNRVKTQNT